MCRLDRASYATTQIKMEEPLFFFGIDPVMEIVPENGEIPYSSGSHESFMGFHGMTTLYKV